MLAVFILSIDKVQKVRFLGENYKGVLGIFDQPNQRFVVDNIHSSQEILCFQSLLTSISFVIVKLPIYSNQQALDSKLVVQLQSLILCMNWIHWIRLQEEDPVYYKIYWYINLLTLFLDEKSFQVLS